MANAALVYDTATKNLIMLVVPDNDAQLSDPAFNPPGSGQVIIPKSIFEGVESSQYYAAATSYVLIENIPINLP